MRKKGNILLVSVLTTLTIALSGCSGDKAGGSSGIVVGIPQDLEDSLDPHKAVAAGTKEVLFNVFEGLVKPDQEGNLVPAVAKEYHISEDGKTYIFSLREGILSTMEILLPLRTLSILLKSALIQKMVDHWYRRILF